MAEAVEVVEEISARVDWFDNVIGRILKAKDHHKLSQYVNLIREGMEDL